MIDINLLPSRDLLTVVERAWQRRLIQATVALGAVVAVSLVIVLGLGQAAQRQVSTLSAQREELLTNFNSDTSKLEMLLGLKDKIAGIKRVRAVRPDLSSAIAIQQGLLVSGVATTRLSVSSSGAMDFGVTVSDVKALSDFLNKLESDETRSFFRGLTIKDIQLGQNGEFSFSVAAEFDKSKLVSGR